MQISIKWMSVSQSAQIMAEHTLCLSPENEQIKVKTALLATMYY